MAQGSTTKKRAMFVWLPNFAMTLARLRKPPLAKAKEPLVLIEKHGNIRRIASLDGPATKAGLYLHQPLGDALAICPELIAADTEPQASETALAALAAWAQRYSPFTAPAGASGLWLDIAGCAHLWGGEAQLAEDLLGRLKARGIPARAAIAPTFGAAYALAHHAQRYVIAEQITYKLLLAPLPVERLLVGGETVSLLQKLGIFTIGAVQDLPRAGLSRRFPDLLPQLDKAMGLVPEAIGFLHPPTPWIERLRFPEPISAPGDLERVTARLLEMLCERLEAGRQGGLRFEMSFFRSDGGVERQAVTAALPTRDAARIMRLFREKLALIDPGFGVDLAMLAAPHTEPLDERQESVLKAGQYTACVEELAALIDSLENRLGKGRVYRLAPQESYIPERAVKRQAVIPESVPATSPRKREAARAAKKTPALPAPTVAPRLREANAAAKYIGNLPSPCPSPSKPGSPGLQTKVIASASGCDGRGDAFSTGTTRSHSHGERAGVRGGTAVWPSAGERPIRLFVRPQPIDVTAALPDAPPVLFRWRRVLHRIVRAEGPERIEPEWWRGAGEDTRDYYRVESEAGIRFWVFREGAYGGGSLPRWYLHGLFA
jgi:protein ImuB